MQIKKILLALAFFCAASVCQASTFNLFFFGVNNKVRVGEGQFTADPKKTICVEIHVLGNCSNPDPGYNQYDWGYVVDRTNLLTDFSATIHGISWGFEAPGKTWWSADGQPPGTQAVSRYGLGLSENAWFFGDPFEGTRQLLMEFNQATASSGSGTWILSAGYDQNNNPLPEWVYANGTFVVKETPIPAALWLFGSALTVFGIFRRKAVGLK